MRHPVIFLIVCCAPLVALGACDAGKGSMFNSGGSGPSSGNGGGAVGGGATSTSSGVGASAGFDPGQGGNTSSGGPTCNSGPDEDQDQDGFSTNEGDCNDCDANVNPGAIEVMTDQGTGGAGGAAEPADENCDGSIDEAPTLCDNGLDIADTDPMNGAKAIDLCQTATANDKLWGVLSAAYVRADGQPFQPGVQVGLIDTFGPNVPPQLGQRMLGMSSGHARTPSQPNPCGSHLCSMTGPGTAPPGFPQDVPNCSGSPDINDDVGLELQIRAPTNATGYSFDFTFYSFEYPEWVCTSFNDQFIALVDPPPNGSINGNISFDAQTNPVSVNIAFFQVCPGCPLGTAELQGTGFDVWDDAGATGWLVTQAPIGGGETFNIRYAIWDTGDQVWDSTVLIDNFQWIANAGTVSVGTEPVPPPQ